MILDKCPGGEIPEEILKLDAQLVEGICNDIMDRTGNDHTHTHTLSLSISHTHSVPRYLSSSPFLSNTLSLTHTHTHSLSL